MYVRWIEFRIDGFDGDGSKLLGGSDFGWTSEGHFQGIV